MIDKLFAPYLHLNAWRLNAYHFATIAESKDPEGEVHDVTFTDLFQGYQQLVESLLEKFLVRHSVSVREFFQECSDVADAKHVPLFQEHEHKWFIDLMHSWLDYMVFFQQMVEEAQLSRRKK